MGMFKWQIVIEGECESPSQEALEKTLANQCSFSVNMAPSVKRSVVTSEQVSGIVSAIGLVPPDHNH